jgi:hypothetical protein
MSEELLPKTPEQLEAERLERYKASPGSFVEIKDILVAAVKSDIPGAEVMIFVGRHKRSLLAQAKTEVDYAVQKHFMIMEAKVQEKQPAIVTPNGGGNGGVMGFARRMRGH